MKLGSKLTAAVAVLAMLATGVPRAATAAPAPAPGAVEEELERTSLEAGYTDAEVLQLLFDGTGPVAEENPELLERLNFAEDRPAADPEMLDEVIEVYLDYHPTFEQDVLDPLTSGNPELVEVALVELTDTYFEMLEDEYEVSELPAAEAAGCGAGAEVCVVAYAVAFVNAGVYANAAVATMAVVALAVVPSAVSYLMAPDTADGELVKTELVASLTRALVA